MTRRLLLSVAVIDRCEFCHYLNMYEMNDNRDGVCEALNKSVEDMDKVLDDCPLDVYSKKRYEEFKALQNIGKKEG